MTQEFTPDWAEYKRVERGHSAGDHSRCDPGRCTDASRLCARNEERLQAIALMATLKRRARTYLGDDYAPTVAATKLQLPDYLYLQTTPDTVHYMAAKVRMKSLSP
jgi:hypothetical protein